jgi:hypothetical protein
MRCKSRQEGEALGKLVGRSGELDEGHVPLRRVAARTIGGSPVHSIRPDPDVYDCFA